MAISPHLRLRSFLILNLNFTSQSHILLIDLIYFYFLYLCLKTKIRVMDPVSKWILTGIQQLFRTGFQIRIQIHIVK